MRYLQTPAFDAALLELPFQLLHEVWRSSHDRVLGAVVGGKVQLRPEKPFDFGGGKRNEQHRACGQCLHEARALGDEAKRMTRLEDTGDARRNVLARAVPNHRSR